MNLIRRITKYRPKRVALPVIIWIVWACSYASGAPTQADGEAAAFSQGVALYQEGRYREAAQVFLIAAEKGAGCGPIYYNIGNCFLKEGRIGEAVYWYERARLAIPRDAALEANYAYAKRQVKQHVSSRLSGFLLPWIAPLLKRSSPAEWCVLWILLSYGWAVALGLGVWMRASRLWSTVTGVLCMIAWAILIPVVIDRVSWAERGAVVIARMTDARQEPLEAAETAFPLFEGMDVRVMAGIPGWAKVERADGKIGWLNVLDIKMLCDEKNGE